MFDAKEAYKLVCEAIDRIDRKDKFNEFETIFERNKNDTQKVKQENSNDEVKRFAANFYKAPIVNYKGYVKGAIQEDKNRYSEVISSTLLSKIF